MESMLRRVKLPSRKPIDFYGETSVNVGKSQEAVRQLLSRFGATRVGFSSQSAPFHALGVTWAMPAEDGGEDIVFEMYWQIQVDQPKRHRRNGKTGFDLLDKAERIAMRALYHSLKAKLNSIQCGLRGFEFEFLADYQIGTPNGMATIGQIISQSPRLLSAPRQEED